MTDLQHAQLEAHDIILYDGLCALCNGVVRYLLNHDPAARFRFVPQQTPLAQQLLAAFPAPTQPEPEGVILLTAALTPHQRLYRRSRAVQQALSLIPGPWPLLGRLSRLIPHPLSELAYSLIARYRYQIFGRYSTCPIPTPTQRERILGLVD